MKKPPQTVRLPSRRRGGRKRKWTPAQIIKELRKSNGRITATARRLRCQRERIYEYLKAYPEIKAELDEMRDYQLDVTEDKLFTSIKKREAWAITLYLKTQGRSRGYVEKQEHEVTAKVEQTVKTLTLTDDELDAELIRRGIPLTAFDHLKC